MSLAYQCLFALALSAVFIESLHGLRVLDTGRTLLGVLQRSLWVMRHPYSPDLRKERLVQYYSGRSLVLTLQLAIRLAVVLAICFAVILLLALMLPVSAQPKLKYVCPFKSALSNPQ